MAFSVNDMATSRWFWTDFGLSATEVTAYHPVSETSEETTIVVLPADFPKTPFGKT